MRNGVDRSAMIRLFKEIRSAFPQLSMQLDHDPQHVELNVDIPKQPGLTFDMNLNLQGDELHLHRGGRRSKPSSSNQLRAAGRLSALGTDGRGLFRGGASRR